MTEERYEDLLRAMADQGGELGALAAYHAREAGLRESERAALAKLDAQGRKFAAELSSREVPDPTSMPNAAAVNEVKEMKETEV